MNENVYLKETNILNYNDPIIQKIIEKNGWKNLNKKNKIKKIYNFVRDNIKFGYNEKDSIKSTQVIKDGYGQCNTKSTLLMSLLRGAGIPCRIHGFTINKKLQKGAISGIWYYLAPKNILHSWVEVKYKDKWYNLEGVILDKNYLKKIQHKFSNYKKFCGFGVFTENLNNPIINWDENDTYIQNLGINQDFGIYEDPDSFYKEHEQELTKFKKYLFDKIVRKSMNRNIKKIRKL